MYSLRGGAHPRTRHFGCGTPRGRRRRPTPCLHPHGCSSLLCSRQCLAHATCEPHFEVGPAQDALRRFPKNIIVSPGNAHSVVESISTTDDELCWFIIRSVWRMVKVWIPTLITLAIYCGQKKRGENEIFLNKTFVFKVFKNISDIAMRVSIRLSPSNTRTGNCFFVKQ